jgi:NADPH:quinone reductase-like Zn-dependent oxidoreductase
MSIGRVGNSQKTMKALLHPRSGGDRLQLTDVEQPTLTDDLVLIKVQAASVNAADWHTLRSGGITGAIAWALRMPVPPVCGSDVAGVVEAVGKDSTRFKPGDKVFGSGLGSFAEYTLAKEDSLALKPADLSLEEAAALPIAGVTALQGLRKANLHPGQSLLVYGAGGGVGTFAVQIGAALGAAVTAVTSPDNLDVVQALQANEVIDYTREDISRRNARYDVVFDVAAVRSLSDLARMVKPDGTLVLAGAAKGSVFEVVGRLANAQFRAHVRRQRVFSFLARVTSEDLGALVDLVQAGKLRPAIDRDYPLEEAGDAIKYLGTGRARAKVVIRTMTK